MSKAKTETKMDSFQSWAHRWGRVGTLIALIYMVALPFVVLAAYDSIPSLGEVFNVSTFSILLIYIPVGFSEALSYTPILGCSAYLAFITGNIMNLKLPVAANAMNLTKKQPNTPEGEAIASVAVAVSSLMTVAILTLAAVCASFISPVFELPAVKTASGYLLPALFGSMALGLFASSASGNKVVKGGIKGVLPAFLASYPEQTAALSVAAKRKRSSDRTRPAYRWVALAIIVGGIVCGIYGIYELVNRDTTGLYFTLLGLAAAFLFSGTQVIPTAKNNKKAVTAAWDASISDMEAILPGDFPVPARYAHPIVLDRMIRVLREGRAQSAKEALAVVKEDLKKLNADVQVEQEEYDEVVAIKPMFLLQEYK